MSRRKRLTLVAAAVLLGGMLFTLVQRWYYVNVTWPRDIQMQTIGEVLASRADMIERSSFAHLGQGVHRWVYRIGNENPEIRSLCEGASMASCNWNRRASPSPNVTQDAIFANGLLTLEESWL